MAGATDSARGRPGRRPPLGLLGMLALVLAVELGLLDRRDDIMTPAAQDWRFAAWAAGRKAAGCDVLCFGDSLVKYGVLPRVIEARTGLKAYNLATSGGTMPSEFFLLERALAAGARPRAVVADFAALMLRDPGPLALHNYPDVATVVDGLGLARAAGDPGFFLSVMVARALPSYRWRFEVRDLVRAALSGRSGSRRAESTNARYHWENHRGAQPMHPGRPFQPREDYLIDGVSPPADWTIAPRDAAYLDRFLALARSAGVTVVWLIPPLAPGSQARRDLHGSDAAYDRLVRAMQSRFPGLVVLDARGSRYADTVYLDHIHLDRAGASVLSADIADALARRLDHPDSAAGAWVALPPFAGRPEVAARAATVR